MRITKHKSVWPISVKECLSVLVASAPHLEGALAPMIRSLMRDLLSSGQLGYAWKNSLLAYNGMPLEFTVSSLRPASLYCTIDPIPKWPDGNLGIDTFLPYYQTAIDSVPSQSAWFDRIRESQSKGELRFGSWLGLKCAANETAVKVYSEVPDQEQAVQSLFPVVPNYYHHLQDLGLKLLMVGYYPDDSERPAEAYYIWHRSSISTTDVKRVMQFFDCIQLCDPFLDYLEEVLKLNEQTAFSETTYGFSITYLENGMPESFSLFTMAPSFFGTNTEVPFALKRILDHYNWDLPNWRVLMDAEQDLQYNVIGFSIACNGMLGLNCTFSPLNERFETAIYKGAELEESDSLEQPLEAVLRQNQLSSGAFTSQVQIPDGRWLDDGNAFVTAQVLRLLLHHTPADTTIIDKALDFLERCEHQPGHFGFWPLDEHPNWMGAERITPDVDDTALITEILYRYGRISKNDLGLTIRHLNAHTVSEVHGLKYPWIQCYTYGTWMQDDLDLAQLDCCANTNVLLLLALGGRQNTPHYHSILRMLKRAVEWCKGDYDRMRRLIPYYAHPQEWIHSLNWGVSEYGLVELQPIADQLELAWGSSVIATLDPLYCRHDGAFLWVSTLLSQLRKLQLITQQ